MQDPRFVSSPYVCMQNILIPNEYIFLSVLNSYVCRIRQSIPNWNTLFKTLAARGLAELFFQLWFCVSFWFWWEMGFGFTYLWSQSTIQLWCRVSFLVLAGNSFWCYIRTQCTILLCGCVSFLVVAGNRSQNENTFLQKILSGYFIMIRQPLCVYHKT